MQQAAYTFLLIWLIWIGAVLILVVATIVRNHQMNNKAAAFDPDIPDHVMGLAVMLDGILNSDRTDIRFALLVWRDRQNDVQGLVSNDTNDKTVIDMLDDAKKQINNASGLIHHTAGNA